MSSSAPLKKNQKAIDVNDVDWQSEVRKEMVREEGNAPPPVGWSSLFETPRLSPVGKPVPTCKGHEEALHIIAAVKPIRISWKNLQLPCKVYTKGLTNNGNMCFLNSVLQALIHCAPLANLFKILPIRLLESLEETPYLLAFSTLFQKFYEKLNERHHSLGVDESETPNAIINCVRQTGIASFQGDQEDAQEFLTFFLDMLHEEFLKSKGSMNWEFSGFGDVAEVVEKEDEEGWSEVGRKQKVSETRTMARVETPISLLFSGQFRSTVKRPSIKDSITFEPFNCLQLEVDHRAIYSLEDSLAFLSRPESIDSGSITKRITIDRLPMVLVIQLKRFVFRNGRSEKVSKFVSYPERLVLDKRIYTQNPTEMASGLPSYRLFAVVNHHGRMSSGGHYTVDVRKSFKQDEFWLRINDTIINKVSLEQVLRERHDANAYLLFYQKTKDFKQHNL